MAQDTGVFKEVSSVDQEERRVSHEQKLADLEANMELAFRQKVQEKENKLQQSERSCMLDTAR